MRIIQSISGPVVVGSLLFAAVASAEGRADTTVYFMHDSASLDAESLQALEKLAEEAEGAPFVTLRLDAFADEVGTTPYNVGLSLRRGVAVREHLERLGIGEDQLVIVAYGEEGPRRETLASNRRVAVTLTDEPLHAIIDDALPGATTVLWEEPVTLAELEGTDEEQTIERTSRR